MDLLCSWCILLFLIIVSPGVDYYIFLMIVECILLILEIISCRSILIVTSDQLLEHFIHRILIAIYNTHSWLVRCTTQFLNLPILNKRYCHSIYSSPVTLFIIYGESIFLQIVELAPHKFPTAVILPLIVSYINAGWLPSDSDGCVLGRIT